MTTMINILIVDDRPQNLVALEAILDHPDYRLVRAETVQQALLALVNDTFALIILDVQMPQMNGFELATLIKERKKTADVPIIFLTAHYIEDAHALDGYAMGAVDYLVKPVNPLILRSKVAVFAELYRKNLASELANRTLAEQATRLQDALEERELLLREIHHRVRNNLQIVMSLLNLQRRKMKHVEVALVLDETIARISAMAGIHEQLYREPSLSQIQFGSYLHTLVLEIVSTFAQGEVKPQFDVQAISLPADTAIPLGLIVTELVTNAIKYGLRERKEGLLRITLSRQGEGRCELTVSDDGPGLPQGLDPAQTESLGLRLVQMLARQLQGKASFAPGPGFTCRVAFPLPKGELVASAPPSEQRVESTD